MEIYIGGRATGKTTTCVKYLINNPNTYLITAPYNTKSCAMYIKQLMVGHSSIEINSVIRRIYTANTFIGFPLRTKVIIDDLDFIKEKDSLINILLIYNVIAVFSSIGDSYDNSGSILRQLINIYGYYKLPLPKENYSLEKLRMLKRMFTPWQYDKEINSILLMGSDLAIAEAQFVLGEGRRYLTEQDIERERKKKDEEMMALMLAKIEYYKYIKDKW